MPSLAACIKKAGGALSTEDAAYLQSQLDAGVDEAKILDGLDRRINKDLDKLATRIEDEGGQIRMDMPEVLKNAPDNVRPFHQPAVLAAQEYARRSGLPYIPLEEYTVVDVDRANRIADAYEQMEHRPNHSDVEAAYAALAEETLAQFDVILESGLKIEFIRDKDPYSKPSDVIDDVVQNNHIWVYPTESGYGMDQSTTKNNPMLQETDHVIDGHKLLVNDVFRIVHDYFGHVKNGVGFRANGEENAFQAHAAMFSPLARRALTTETRGQNSWLNFGPHGAKNRTAKTEDTIFAEQKIGLLPIWATNEGRLTGPPANTIRQEDTDGRKDGVLVRPPVKDGMVTISHFSTKRDLKIIDPDYFGTAGAGAERERAGDKNWVNRSYFGIEPNTKGGYKKEWQVGNNRYDIEVPAHLLYDMENDPDGLMMGKGTTAYEKAIYDAGYLGYWVKPSGFGMVGAVFEPLSVDQTTVLNQSAVALRDGRETLKKYGLDPTKKYNTREVAAALEERTVSKSGRIGKNDRSDEAMRKVARYITQEVKFEMQHPEHSGVGWYSEKYARALEVMSRDFPELQTDQTARDTFTALIAITSDGQKVVGNFKMAHDLYANYKETGSFVTDRGHNRGASIDNNLSIFQGLIEEHGIEGAHEFLMQEKTVRELKQIAPEFTTSYPVDMKLPMAAIVFGPKLGAFYGNLMGSHGYLTMDRWWSRTINRYRGTLLTSPTRASMTRFKKLIDQPTYTDRQVLAAVVGPRDAYAARNYWTQLEKDLGKKQPNPASAAGKKWREGKDPKMLHQHDIEKAANSIHKMAFENLEDRPFNSSDRKFMFDAVEHARKSLSRSGIEMSVADIQAVLWYYEKRLYGEMGARQTADISYEDAAMAALADGKEPSVDGEIGDFQVLNQAAYHGTSHNVDKFTTDKIGTGEGTKAFGWGMYFASKIEVADHYRKGVSMNNMVDSFLEVLPEDADFQEVMDMVSAGEFTNEQRTIIEALNENDWLGFDFPAQAINAAFKHLHSYPDVTESLTSAMNSVGNIYQVELAPQENEYLLWDRPFTEQPQHIQDKLAGVFGLQPSYFEALGWDGGDMYEKLTRQLGSDKAASESLHTMGIKGVKFLDQGSRSGGPGATFNYVIFHDDDVAITQQFEQFNRARIYTNEQQRIIQLGQASDLSSFLHESGHLFLEMEKIFAKEYGISSDQKAILSWLGVENFDQVTVDHHETWAETFEAYLRTGQAPSLGLRRAFAAFSRWLKVIYRSLTEGGLDRASLDPTITGIFDRMLATQEEIAEAAANPQYDQFFQSKEQSGMSDKQWEEYLARAARVKNSAEMTIDEKAVKQYMKTKTREWEAEKAPITKEMFDNFATMQRYQVFNDMRKYKDENGNEFEGRMDRDMLAEALGGEIPDRLKGKHVKRGGLDPQLIAETYRYPSVQAMVDDIVNNPTQKQAAEDAAQESMIAKYGDILNDGTLEQEVREALTNEDQAAMLLMEINALARQNQKPGINRAYLKSQAQMMIGNMSYDEIQPDRYYRGMIKAAKDSVRMEDPTDAKIQELSNHYLYKEALRVKEQMTKNRTKVRGAQNRNYDTRKVDSDYVQQIKLLGNMYEMKRGPEQLVALDTILNFYTAQLRNTGGELTDLTLLDPNLVRAMEYRDENNGNLRGFELIQFKDLTSEDLQGVVDMLTHLRYVGGQIAQMNGEEAVRERMEFVEWLRNKGGKDHKLARGRQRSLESERRTWNHIVNTMPSLANMIRKLDGMEAGGQAFNLIYQELVAANNTKYDKTRQFYEELEDLMGDMARVGLSRRDAVAFETEQGPKDFSSEERFMIALYWGTESSREAVMQGHGLTEENAMEIMSTLTEDQLHLVNAIWAMNETQWPDLAKAGVEMEGVAPPKLRPVEFVVNGVQMTGGHMQLFYDSQRIEMTEETEQASRVSSVMPTRAGSLNARVGSGGQPVLLDINNVSRSVDDKIHYIAFARAGRKLRMLVNHSDVRNVIERKHGPGFYRAFVESIIGVTSNRMGHETHAGAAKVLRHLRTSATMMHLAYSIRNTVQQFSAIPIAGKEVGPVNLMMAYGQYASNYAEVTAFVNERSKFMENRAQVINRDSREVMKRLISTSKMGHVWEEFKSRAFIFQTMADSTIAYPTWMAAYNNAMEKHGNESQARTEADTAVAETVGSGSDMHLGRIMQSSQSEGIKTLTIFGSWFNAYYQRLYRSSKGGSDFVNAAFAMDAIVLPFIAANMVELLILNTPDDDETMAEYLFNNTWKFLAATVPVMRELGSLIEGFTPTAPINTLPQSLVRVPQEINALAEGRQTGLKTASDIGKAVTGVVKTPGSGQLWRILDYVDSYIEGNEGDTFNPYQMLTEGADKDE
jgi:hypothetical protein